MRILEFEINGQHIRKKRDCDFTGLVAGTSGYLYAKFHFSKDWNGCLKVASFWASDDLEEFPVELEEFEGAYGCVIPAEVLTGETFRVSVLGGKGQDYRIRTGKSKVVQRVV